MSDAQGLGARQTGQNAGGDSAHGAPQTESAGASRDNAFQVNQAFIDQEGPEAAATLKAVLERVGSGGHGDDIVEIHNQLAQGLDEAGLTVAEVEVNNMADRIARSQQTVVNDQDHHADLRPEVR